MAEFLLCRTRALLLGRRPCKGLSIRFAVKPSTGEPDAGELHVRFGGRGDRETDLFYPYLPAEYQAKCDGSFESACHWRRVVRLKPYMGKMKKVLYAKHFNIRGCLGAMGCTGDWKPGSGLYTLTMDNYYPEPEVLLEDPWDGVIKDPCISPDGRYLVFAWWKKSIPGGCHIFEMDLATKETRQITDNPVGLEVGDFEPCILPNGDILFNSSRFFGMGENGVDIVSNLYICNRNGEWLRRISYDHDHTFCPVMMSDGKVLYSRWEYNDRTRISCGGFFTMNPDGCMQNEYWGNQSDFPLRKFQAREIPNSGGKLMGIAGGNLAPYMGEVVFIDPTVSRNRWPGNDNTSIKMLAPVREAPMDPSEAVTHHSGNVEYTFQNPWPFDEENFLVSWGPKGSLDHFKIYFFNADASRELLAWDEPELIDYPMNYVSVSQPIVIDPPCPFDKVPPLYRQMADYTREKAVLSVANVYLGMGSAGVEKGSIKKLRVISIGPYRTNYSQNVGYLGFAPVPISAPHASWHTKTLLGEIPVEEDGSACFEVPPNTPLFFQTVDKDGRMINTMRSWATLMPGERWDCLGCHEDKNEAPVAFAPVAVMPKPLETPLGFEGKPMSFPKIIQPILDRHCVSCHNAAHDSGLDLRANPSYDTGGKRTFNESYKKLTDRQGTYVDWIDLFSDQFSKAAPVTEFPAPGSGTSPLADKLLEGHAPEEMTPGELETIFCWIDMMVPHAGTYYEGMTEEDSTTYVTYLAEHRFKHEQWEKENIAAFIEAGQWDAPIYHGTAVSDPEYSGNLKVRKDIAEELRVTPFNGRLVVQCPGTGVLSLFDMKGRLLAKVNVTDAMKNGKLQMSLPLTMSSGIYVVKFKSKHAAMQRIVSSL